MKMMVATWQFLNRNPVNINEAKIVFLQKIIKIDPSIEQLADLPLGWIAARNNIESS